MNQENQLTKRTFSGFLYLLSASGLQVVLKIGVLAVLARLISPKEFGLAGIAVIIVEFSKLFAHMGVGPAIVQRKELEDRHLTTAFTLSILTGLFFAGLLVLAAPLLETFFRMEGLVPILRTIAVVFFIDSLTVLGQAQLQRAMKFKVIASVEVISYAVGYGGVGILLAYLGYGVWALAIANIAQAVLYATAVTIVQPSKHRLGLEKDAMKELLVFGGGFTIAKIGNFLANQGDNLVVGRMLGAGALGIYGRAYQFMVMPAGLFGNALDRSLFPAMSKVQDDKERLIKGYLTGTSIIALAAIPISVLFVFMAPEIILILLGKNWVDVILPFRILACSLLFRMSYKMSDSLARATGAVYKRAWRQIAYATAVIGGSYFGSRWGLPGVACGVAFALVLNFLMMTHLSLRLTGIGWGKVLEAHKHGLLLGMVTVVFCSIMSFLCRQLDTWPVLTLAGTVLGVGLLLVVSIWLFPNLFIRHDQKELLNKLVVKRFKKIPARAA
ncbi:lipopolysaccharide biosynthesis protein [Paraflavisolibacter sp. H34]|uniref:lipopolysaccharide biosynthesis protein n=1 Tax=Huijunlia imazamoxiresistens TaxID=3127457 RepID=UPI0030198D78